MNKEQKPAQYSWTIFDENGDYVGGGSPASSRADLKDVKERVREACWRQGYTGILVGVDHTGVVLQWKYTKE